MNVSVLPWTFLRQWASNFRSAAPQSREEFRSEPEARNSAIGQFQTMMEYNANLFVRSHTEK